MSLNFRRFAWVLFVSLMVMGLSKTHVIGETFNLSFKPFQLNQVPNNTSLLGDAKMVSDGTNVILSLTEFKESQRGTWIVDGIARDKVVTRLEARFQVRILQPYGSVQGDGMSFNFGPELIQSAVGEDGITNGLSITFDTYDNGYNESTGEDDSAPAIEVVYGGQILNGKAFKGYRSNRPAGYSRPWLPQYPGTFNNSAFIPVVIALESDAPDKGWVVSVWWSGDQVISKAQVPFTPQSNWRVAFGARTGASIETHDVRDVEIDGESKVRLKVVSDFGENLVTPAVGTYLLEPGQKRVVTAPTFVYLDRFKRPLGGEEAATNSLAHFRARLLGGKLDDGSTTLRSGETISPERNATLTWSWELEYLAEINTGTEAIVGLSPSDVTDSAHVETLGRRYMPQSNTSFDSVVYRQVGGEVVPIRFSATHFVAENAPNSPEFCLELSGKGDHLRSVGPITEKVTGEDGSFTTEFWARLNPASVATRQTLFTLGSVQEPTRQLRVGFAPNRSLFATDGVATISAPSGLTDSTWHHWAIVNDPAKGQTRIFRDGVPCMTNATSFVDLKTDGVVTIGAVVVDGQAVETFSGGINNVRLWNAPLDDRVRTRVSLTVGEVMEKGDLTAGVSGPPNLVFEFAGDMAATTLRQGALVERRSVDLSVPYSNADDVLSWTRGSVQINTNGMVLPSASGDVGTKRLGWITRTRLSVPSSDTYTFSLRSSGACRLYFDGQLLVASDRPVGTLTQYAEVNVASGFHLIEARMVDAQPSGDLYPPRVLEIRYRQNSDPSFRDLPVESLSPSAGDLVAAEQLVLGASALQTLAFRPVGFESLLRRDASVEDFQKAILPGFMTGFPRSFGQNTVQISERARGPITDWRRVFWNWQKQFRMEVSVTASDVNDIESVQNLPYLTAGISSIDQSPRAAVTVGPGVVRVWDIWLEEGRPLTVGAVYRTADRRYTLEAIDSNLNLFGSFGWSDLQDGVHADAVSREYLIDAVGAPGSLTFRYGRTVHRTTVAIGEAFDVSSRAVTTAPLMPDLPDSVVDLDPNSLLVDEPISMSGTTTTGGVGAGWVLDKKALRWFPLRPGRFTLIWADKKGYTNQIEVVAQFPDGVQTLPDWERKDGSRYGMPPSYALDYRFNPVNPKYPGAPLSQYLYSISPNSDRPYPGDLDPSREDAWKFLRVAFSEQQTYGLSDDRIFTEMQTQVRSVLLYSHRETPNDVATGDLNRETLHVRILRSVDITTNEIATVGERIASPRDLGGFRSAFVVWPKANYNAQIYTPNADPGQWGPVYAVNSHVLQRLTLGWFDNPARLGVEPPGVLPAATVQYPEIRWPDPATADVIYLASRMGSEGVGQAVSDTPNYQMVFDPAQFDSLLVYNQPDRSQNGYNPNEEHAFVAPSASYALTRDSRFNLDQSTVYALQNQINRTGSDPAVYTSEPYVLVQYRETDPTRNPKGEFSMKAYRVLSVRTNATSKPFPALDPETREPVDAAGNPVPQPSNPSYVQEYSAFAGGIVVPPYPLSLAIGNVPMTNSTGGNIRIENRDGGSVNQRTLWFDRNHQSWVVSGDGRFFQRFWYPLRPDFWFGEGSERPVPGTAIAWMPTGRPGDLKTFTGASVLPVASKYTSYWRKDYPVLKRGETLTYQGGEYRKDHPSSPGLPGVLAWASGEVVFDSGLPNMVFNDEASRSKVSVLLTRPLDSYRQSIPQSSMPDTLQPKNAEKVMVSGGRWYFKELSASLGGRLYYDPPMGQLVFRGRLNGKESGDRDLTVVPISAYSLEPNVPAAGESNRVMNLAQGHAAWETAVKGLFGATGRSPLGFATNPPSVAEVPFFSETLTPVATDKSTWFPARSLGTGAALVPNGEFLSQPSDGRDHYVTLVENNDPKAGGAVAVHVLRVDDERYRGSIQVINPPNVFDEKIELQHSGEFGGRADQVYFQWWIRDVDRMDRVGTPDDGQSGWQIYQQGLGLSRIQFTGRPDITLADKLFFVRYGGSDELAAADPRNVVDVPGKAQVFDESWRLVRPDALTPDWTSGGKKPVPYQWAGALNSPQIQADGSRRFLPQLVMGWVKRVLMEINPFEARFKSTFSGDSPATFTSMLRQAGRPFLGPVALNPEKDVLENVGLIELYETVLDRAKTLTEGNRNSGTDQAILLAATRLALLYDLLGSEAYADAGNPSIPLTAASASYIARGYAFAFENIVPSLLEEELALLRGTDQRMAYPVVNRLFWNYTKGLGEAAYNINYSILDANQDGIIGVDDAALLYPMGHGDAWGHQLSALKMHYELLKRPGFRWEARPEYYAQIGNVIETDYLDEKSFARTAARRVQTGVSVVKGTYRSAYVSDPVGQWQGYADLADPARAWGVTEWASRVGQGALFDWVIANAITPASSANASTNPVVGLDRIDRIANEAELNSIASAITELNLTVRNINLGQNPLGFDDDAMAFDVSESGGGTPFEQVFQRALKAVDNAQTVLDFSIRVDQVIGKIALDTADLQKEAIRQDLTFRNRLIGLYGTPYEGTIGPGKIFKEGYEGPDLITSLYVDQTDVNAITPKRYDNGTTSVDYTKLLKEVDDLSKYKIADWNLSDFERGDLSQYFKEFYLTKRFGETLLVNEKDLAGPLPGGLDAILVTRLPLETASDYGMTAPSDWGRRRATGAIQDSIKQLLQAQIEVRSAVTAYDGYLRNLAILLSTTQQHLEDFEKSIEYIEYWESANRAVEHTVLQLESFRKVVKRYGEMTVEHLKNAEENGQPTSIGFLGGIDALFGVRFLEGEAVAYVQTVLNGLGIPAAAAQLGLENTLIEIKGKPGLGKFVADNFSKCVDLLKGLSVQLAAEEEKRQAITGALNRMNMAADRVRSVQAEGLRVQQERTALNRQIAAKAQRSRYEDLVNRLTRNEAARQYDTTLETALRYSYLAIKAYDYETSLSEGHPASSQSVLDDLFRIRQLGLIANDQTGWFQPQVGNGGLAEILTKVRNNHRALKSQLGLDSPQGEVSTFSLRREYYRVPSTPEQNSEWRTVLAGRKVANLWDLPEYVAYCRPTSQPTDGPQPALVIEFPTTITPGKNVFGNTLAPGDRYFSVAEYATKIRSHAIAFTGYDNAGSPQLASSPRAYLVPVGVDRQRTSDSQYPVVREWKVVSQRVPTPYVLNTSQLLNMDYISGLRGVDGSFVDRIRFSDTRAFTQSIAADDQWNRPASAASASNRLYGRSVWNTRWLLIIPGASLGPDPEAALQRFVETVTDIEIQFQTYSNPGM